MQISNYFQGALGSYQAELQDLAGARGEDQFEENIAAKRSSLDTLMPMSADFPEIVAPIFHGTIKFTNIARVKRLVANDLEDFPTWEILKEDVIFADQELVKQVLKYKNGEFLLIFAIAMEFLFTQKSTVAKEKVVIHDGSPDVDSDWGENEAPNLTGLDPIDSE